MDACADLRKPSHVLTAKNTRGRTHVNSPSFDSTTFAAKDALTQVTALRRNVGQCWNYGTEEEELVDYKHRKPARDGTNKNSIIMQCSAAGLVYWVQTKPIIPLCAVLHIHQNESLSFDECLKDTHNYPEMRVFIILWLLKPNAKRLVSSKGLLFYLPLCLIMVSYTCPCL